LTNLLELFHDNEVLRKVLFAKGWKVKAKISLLEIGAGFEPDWPARWYR
jgi:hypothetical protein